MISAVELEAWEPPESLKMHSFRYIFQYFLSEVGSVSSPESLKIERFLHILQTSSVEQEAWEG